LTHFEGLKIDVAFREQFVSYGLSQGQGHLENRGFMTFGLLVLHLWGFVMPALAMALLMPWAGRWVMGPSARPMRRHMLVHAVSGLLVLVAGLWLHDQDGKMSTYMALVLVAATLEWVMHRGWTKI
jgi:hypothetical protein